MSYIFNNGGGSIGSSIGSGTAKSVLFLGTSGVLAQDNANFQYDSSTKSLLVTSTTTSAPGFSVYAGTGMYHVGTGLLGFATNSTLVLSIDTSSRVGLLTTNATHSFTIGSTATGIAWYNTVDTATNYERTSFAYSSNEFQLVCTKGGTGTTRPWRFNTGVATYYASPTGVGFNNYHTFNVTAFSSGASAGVFGFLSAPQQSSGTLDILRCAPTLTQTGTAGYTAIIADVTETSTGSGAKLLYSGKVGGNVKFSVNNAGLITTNSTTLIASNQALTNGAGANTGTLLNSPVTGNPTKWVPIDDNGTIRYFPTW